MFLHPQGEIVTAAQMRAAEEFAMVKDGTSLAELMERAGAAVAEATWRYCGGRPILILCGPGNNGGDGYVAARLLKQRGATVRVAALSDPQTDLAKAARAQWDGPVEPFFEAKGSPVVVDALLGTGVSRPLDAELATHLYMLCSRAEFSLAVDLPSGLGTDDGARLGAPIVSMTLALGLLKRAHVLQPAADMCGIVRIADIGLDISAWVSLLGKPSVWAPSVDSHKYRRGFAAIAGGQMGGAAMLAARSAMRRVGYVAITGARSRGPDALVYRRWEDVATDARVGALLIGPGLGRDDKAKAQLEAAFESSFPLVLDADALMIADVDRLATLGRPVILTPHEGEFAALFGTLPGSKIDRAKEAAKRSKCVVILKGPDTVIAEPDGQAVVAWKPSTWLASAGTGDVLAGLAVAALAARAREICGAYAAAREAVWLHHEAARLAGPALVADDLPDVIPGAIKACLR